MIFFNVLAGRVNDQVLAALLFSLACDLNQPLDLAVLLLGRQPAVDDKLVSFASLYVNDNHGTQIPGTVMLSSCTVGPNPQVAQGAKGPEIKNP